MEKFIRWWNHEDAYSAEKRYLTLVKSVLLALLPAVCVLVYCAAQGRTVGEVFLPASEWNDELFYYKQVEGIVNYGYPQGYFGFNESHALKLSFAAWSPVLVFPWIFWGLLFGWNLMSPVCCNLFLMSLCCFLFVWLVKPAWKQLGILTLLFCLYTPFVRYMLSGMPEVICFCMLILFYSLAICYLRSESGRVLILLFFMSGVMTLMRPYMLLFLLLPAYFWIRRKNGGCKGAAGSAAVIAFVLGVYACIKHFFGAEYFAPLFFTDWISVYFERGIIEGLWFTLSKLYYMGRDFLAHTVQGFRTGLASGAFFASYLVCAAILAGWSLRDWMALRRKGRAGKERNLETGALCGNEAVRVDGKLVGDEAAGADGKPVGDEAAGTDGKMVGNRGGVSLLAVEVHMAFSFIAMLFALLLMYKLTEGSKHLLTFMAAAVFLIPLMETKFYKKAVLLGVTFAYFFSYKAVEPYDYQVPFVQEERLASLENWQEALTGSLELDRENVPGYENVVIWTFGDRVEGTYVNTPWQLLYALPEGFGISCCMDDYVRENFETLKSQYLACPANGEIHGMCLEAGYQLVYGDEEMVLYRRTPLS